MHAILALMCGFVLVFEGMREAQAEFWLPPRDSNPDMLSQSQISPLQNKDITEASSVKRAELRTDPPTIRTHKYEEN